MTETPAILQIDRGEPFSFAKLGAAVSGQFYTLEREDPRALALTEIDTSKIRLEILVDSSLRLKNRPESDALMQQC